MDKRIEVRCTEAELAGWKLAAGRVPLSVWIRDVLTDATDVRSDAVGGEGGKIGLPVVHPTRPFRSDFKR